MSKLEIARKKLREAENTVARLQGEESALQVQLNEAREKLAGLGVSEEEAPQYLERLEAEEKSLLAELDEIEKKITQALERKTSPEDFGGSSQSNSLLDSLDL